MYQKIVSLLTSIVGMNLMVALPCSDGTDPAFFGKPVFVDNGFCQWRQQWDEADGAHHHR